MPQTGPGGVPLALRLSEGLGNALCSSERTALDGQSAMPFGVRLSEELGVMCSTMPPALLHPFLNEERQSINNFPAEDDFINVPHVKHVNHSAQIGSAAFPPGVATVNE